VIIDLGGAVPAELVVVRGCDGGCAVEVSADGATFTAAGSVSDEFGAVSLGGAPVTAVRVGVGSGIGSHLREVSVWGPRPAKPALEPVDRSERHGLRQPYAADGAHDDDIPRWLVVLALALAAGTLVGAGFAAGRLRR
jgi:hypothetical protein